MSGLFMTPDPKNVLVWGENGRRNIAGCTVAHQTFVAQPARGAPAMGHPRHVYGALNYIPVRTQRHSRSRNVALTYLYTS